MRGASVSARAQVSRLLSKGLLVACLSVAALCAGARSASASAIISVASSTNLFVGDLFTVDFRLDNVTDLFSYQLGLHYDSSLLSVVGVNEGGLLQSAGGTSFISGDTSTPGTISFIANSLSGFGPGASGTGSLFSVQFMAIASGVASAGALFDPLLGDGLYDSLFNASIPDVGADALVTIAPLVPVPEPTTLLSFGIGLATWGASRRRRRRQVQSAR